ncbi:MAG TPA: cytochrome ubiquinol oxidase subunit I, partial [Corynebacterium nuruki]|nr:cytochrome ubiquinol oxidase subunit I [Corynebacterium nuruki]
RAVLAEPPDEDGPTVDGDAGPAEPVHFTTAPAATDPTESAESTDSTDPVTAGRSV